MKTDLHEVRVEAGENRLFTRVFIDGKELRGITRVWFDSGRIDDTGPRYRYMNRTTVHIEFVPERLLLGGELTQVDLHETAPAVLK